MILFVSDVDLIRPLIDTRLLGEVPVEDKHLWNKWAPCGLILISLVLQITLSLLGNTRKHNPRIRVRITLWITYFLSFAVAITGLSILMRVAFDNVHISKHHKLNTSELTLFWAPFLLLHLGGTDAITAFGLEDNELWLRHFVQFVFQLGLALYILLLSWSDSSHLPQLSILVYIAGFIKCFERLKALRLASTSYLRESMLAPAGSGPNYHKVLKNIHLKNSQGFNLNVNVDKVAEPLLPANDHAYPQRLQGNEISKAYDLFQTFKRLFVDLILPFEDRCSSQSYFRRLKTEDAFRAVEIELGFAYDMLYTKANVVYTSRGLLLRLVCFFLLVETLVRFYFLSDMNNHQIIDVVITYLLIETAILLEIVSFINMICSDWTDHWLSQRNLTRDIFIFPFLKHPTKQRWSDSIAQLDLLSVALEEKPTWVPKIQEFFGIDNIHVKRIEVSNNLKDLIYSHFRELLVFMSDPKELCSHKGSFSLRNNKCESLVWTINEMEFDQSVLIWHIATDLCYYSELENDDDIYACRTESKNISHYMLHLLVSYPVMLPVRIGMISYRDTCAEAMRFVKEKGPIATKVEACRMLLQVDCLEDLPGIVMKDRSKSALFDGCRLALSLKLMERARMWKVMSQLWIEVLVYTATHCRIIHHEQQLSKGGEFLTHVWLLMVHLGITK